MHHPVSNAQEPTHKRSSASSNNKVANDSKHHNFRDGELIASGPGNRSIQQGHGDPRAGQGESAASWSPDANHRQLQNYLGFAEDQHTATTGSDADGPVSSRQASIRIALKMLASKVFRGRNSSSSKRSLGSMSGAASTVEEGPRHFATGPQDAPRQMQSPIGKLAGTYEQLLPDSPTGGLIPAAQASPDDDWGELCSSLDPSVALQPVYNLSTTIQPRYNTVPYSADTISAVTPRLSLLGPSAAPQPFPGGQEASAAGVLVHREPPVDTYPDCVVEAMDADGVQGWAIRTRTSKTCQRGSLHSSMARCKKAVRMGGSKDSSTNNLLAVVAGSHKDDREHAACGFGSDFRNAKGMEGSGAVTSASETRLHQGSCNGHQGQPLSGQRSSIDCLVGLPLTSLACNGVFADAMDVPGVGESSLSAEQNACLKAAATAGPPSAHMLASTLWASKGLESVQGVGESWVEKAVDVQIESMFRSGATTTFLHILNSPRPGATAPCDADPTLSRTIQKPQQGGARVCSRNTLNEVVFSDADGNPITGAMTGKMLLASGLLFKVPISATQSSAAGAAAWLDKCRWERSMLLACLALFLVNTCMTLYILKLLK